MKKIIALAVALAVGSASLFALPAAGIQDNLQPVQSIQSVKTQTVKADVSKDVPASALTQTEDDLFAEVQSVSLTDEEAQAVEGEGWFEAIIGGLFGGACGGIGGGLSGGPVGAIIGAIVGAASGAYQGATSDTISGTIRIKL